MATGRQKSFAASVKANNRAYAQYKKEKEQSMNIPLSEGYSLFLSHNESIALARAILEYTQNHPMDKGVDVDTLNTLMLLMKIIEKMPDVE